MGTCDVRAARVGFLGNALPGARGATRGVAAVGATGGRWAVHPSVARRAGNPGGAGTVADESGIAQRRSRPGPSARTATQPRCKVAPPATSIAAAPAAFV